MGIFGANGWPAAVERIQRPRNIEGGVVPEDRTFPLGVIEIGGFVEDFGSIGEDEESVGESFGNPEGLEFSIFRQGFEVKTS